eukprot:258970-Rhodomonas_salina.2
MGPERDCRRVWSESCRQSVELSGAVPTSCRACEVLTQCVASAQERLDLFATLQKVELSKMQVQPLPPYAVRTMCFAYAATRARY